MRQSTLPLPGLLIPSPWVRYVLAVGIFAVSLSLRLIVLPANVGFPYLTFYPAVVIATLLGGVGPGLLCLALSGLSAAYVFMPPYWAVPPLEQAWPPSAIFAFSAGAMVAIIDRFQRDVQRAWAERDRMQEELLRERALLASVTGTTDVMLVYLDPQFNFMWVNDAYAQTCQVSPEALIGKNHFALYPHAENEAIFRQVRDTGVAVFHKDRPFAFPDQPERGTTYWDWSLVPDKGSDGGVIGLVFSLRETTEFVHAQLEVREKQQLLETFIENVPLGAVMFDRNMRYLAVSRVFLDDHGVVDTDVIGRSHYDVMPNVPEHWRQVLRRCVEGETIHCEEDRFLRTDGMEISVRWDVRPWQAANGTVGGVILVAENITDRKRAENSLRQAKEEAERASNAKSRFLAAASHDLRQPLSALSLYVGSLRNKLPATETHLATSIGDCVSHLNELLSDLLDLSKLEAGAVTPRVTDFALDAAFSKIAATHAPEAAAKGLYLRCAYFGLTGRTDPVLFQRIVGNLVANAVRYTERGGVLIGTRRRQGKRWVEVWDTGMGIPADKIPEIFEEFKQLSNPERNRAKGSGLGLTIASKTAALLGLELRVRSIPGRGSLFAVEIPEGKTAAPFVENSYAHRSLRIALVEDNAEVAAALVYALTDMGHRTVAASSLGELTDLLAGESPDIVISDYRLAGDEDGFGVIRALKADFGAELPALVITGDTDPAVIRRMAAHSICVLHKPLDFDTVRERVAALTASGTTAP